MPSCAVAGLLAVFDAMCLYRETRRALVYCHHGIGPQRTMLIMVLGMSPSTSSSMMDPLGNTVDDINPALPIIWTIP